MNTKYTPWKIDLKVFLFILTGLLSTQVLCAQSWYSGSWQYRSPVTIINAGSALTDYQVKVSLGPSFPWSHAMTDGADIRLTASDGTTLIPFWIENWISGTSASIWMKVPTVAAGPATTTIYLYYGNPSASSEASGVNTFEFFDDFESWNTGPTGPAPLPTPKADETCAVFGGKLYAIGGYNNTASDPLNETYEYDPLLNTWQIKAPMPTRRWGPIAVEFNGDVYVFGGQLPSGAGSSANEIYHPMTDTWTSRSLGNPLSLPAYGASGVVHPDVLYFPEGKDGYEYWMAYTPYPPQAAENPSVLRSHDGLTWTENGIDNPVIPDAVPPAWNSLENPDPDFIYVSAFDKWFMIWDGGDEATNSRKIALAYSSDGKTWTQYDGSPVNGNTNPVILSGTDNNGQAWETDGNYSKTCTPTLIYESGTFYLFYAEEASGNNRGKIGLATFTWNNTTNSVENLTRNINNPIIDLPADAIFKAGGGHIDISKNPNTGLYHMYVSRELMGSANYELGLLTSSDRLSWTNQGKAIARGAAGQWDETHIYRSSPVVTSSGEIVFFNGNIRMYYSAFSGGTPGIGIADILPGGTVQKFAGDGPQPIPSTIAAQGLMGVKYGDKIHLFYKSYHYEYDPANDTYLQKADVPRQVTWSTCATVGSKIYIIGGYSYDAPTDACGDNYEYDPSTDTWAIKAPMPVSRYGATRENPVIDGKIYVTHGHAGNPFFVTNYAYDPVTDTWEQKQSAIWDRDGVGCGVINNKLYVVGGRRDLVGPYGTSFNEIYDPATNTWESPQSGPGSSDWTVTSQDNVYVDGSAGYQGNYGLVIRQTSDIANQISAQSVTGFGNVYALDFDWQVTDAGGYSYIPGGNIKPQALITLSEGTQAPLFFYNLEGTPSLRWYAGSFNTLTNSTFNNWHKTTVVRNGASSSVIFDGTSYQPLTSPTGGTGRIQFGIYFATTQYIDNVRVRKWGGTDPSSTIGSEQSPTGLWNGSAGTEWNNDLNWYGGIPGASTDVTIPPVSNQPVISGTTEAICRNLTISSAASLTIDPTGRATISAALTNNGTLNLESDEYSIASLIMGSYTGTGTANVQIYLSGGGAEALNDWSWHYISFPVDNLSVSALNDNEGDPIDDLAGYYENLATTDQHSAWYGYDGWDYQLGVDNGVITFNNLELGKGYNYYNLSPITRSFGGALFTGTTTKYLSYTGADVNLETKGWNLLGNPYTSSIDWDELSKSLYGIDNAIYFTHNNAPVVYVAGIGVPLGATARIPPMQGFFVKANQSARAVTFGPSARRHSDINRYKGEGETIPLVRLKLENQNISDEAVIRFDEKAREEFDSELDAYKFSKTGTYVSLWTALGSVSYSVNSIPFPEVKTMIPVGINISESGTFSLSALQLQAIDNYDVFLTDKLTGITVNLRNTPSLSFTASQGMLEDRFVIEITTISTGVEIPQKPESIFNIYASNDFINIQTLADEWDGKSGSVDIIDMTGRTINKIEKTEFWKNSLLQIPSAGYKGVYFVILRSEMMKFVGKVISK